VFLGNLGNEREAFMTTRRVLLKLSGEAFGGGTLGVNPDIVSGIAQEIAAAAKDVQVAIVVGGGTRRNGEKLMYGIKLDIKPFE
jgi:uridylate kinase